MRSWLICLNLLLCASAAQAAPPTPAFDLRILVGRPARAVRVRVTETDAGPVLHVGRATTPLPLPSVPTVAVQPVALAGGGRVALLTLTAGERRIAVLVSRPKGRAAGVLWLGELGKRGDPGERVESRIQLRANGDSGAAGIMVSRVMEGISTCTEPRPALFAEVVDPQRLTLRPAPIGSLSPASPGETAVPVLLASTESPGPEGAATLAMLRGVAVSSSGESTEASALRLAARRMTDGDAKSVWRTPVGIARTGQFATFRWEGTHWPLRALAVTLAPASPGAGVPPVADANHAAVRLRLSSEAGALFDLELPGTSKHGTAPAGSDGQRRYWFVPPEPVAARCLTLTVLAGAGPALPALGLAEVSGYSELEFGDAVPALVRELAAGGASASAAGRLLAGVGAAALPALRAQWSAMAEPARRRALALARPLADRSADALALIISAAEGPASALRQEALAALVGLGAPAAEARAALLRRGDVGVALATALARGGGAVAMDELLAALVDPGATPLAGLHAALGEAVSRQGTAGLARLEAWSAQPSKPALDGIVAYGLRGRPEAAAITAGVVERSLTTANVGDFETAWRLVEAAATLTSSAKVDSVLETLAEQDERWMLRDAALRALAGRGAERFEAVARKRLLDPYPRVRASAVRGLGARGAATKLLSKHAAQDRWHLVRVAALEALPDGEASRGVMLGRLRDRLPVVRRAAILALLRVQDAGAWEEVAPRVADDNEYPQVIEAGITFAQQLCIKSASPILRRVVERGFAPDAWDPDRALAATALRALQALEGRAAVQSLAALGGPEVQANMARGGEKAAEIGCGEAK